MAADKIELIPWDARDKDHCARMYDQRVACGWRQEEVEEWRPRQLEGTKLMYWLVVADHVAERESWIEDHCARYPNESTPLTDTAASVGKTPREPSRRAFVPVGHVALERLPDRDARYGLPTDGTVYWITGLYVSWALQAAGLGRSAMRQLERLAAGEPLGGRTMALDTVPEWYQFGEVSIKALYLDRGMPVPNPRRSNEQWYRRQGYEVIAEEKDAYEWKTPSGEVQMIPELIFRKQLV